MNQRPLPAPGPQGAQDSPVVHRDAEGAERMAPSWESLVERLIREAQAEGRFDDLPGRGKPLALADSSAAGDMALAYHLLGNAGVAPPWIEADKAVRALEGDIERLIEGASSAPPAALARLRRRLDELVDEHERAVARLTILAPTPRLHRRRLDRAVLQGRLMALQGRT